MCCAIFAAPQVYIYKLLPLQEHVLVVPLEQALTARVARRAAAAEGGQPPAWLGNGFIKLEDIAKVDVAPAWTFAVYRSAMPMSGQITLGGNAAPPSIGYQALHTYNATCFYALHTTIHTTTPIILCMCIVYILILQYLYVHTTRTVIYCTIPLNIPLHI